MPAAPDAGDLVARLSHQGRVQDPVVSAPVPEEPGATTPKRAGRRRALLALLALAALPRFAILLAPRVDIYGPGSEEDPSVFVGEEVARGSIAQDWIDGPLLPLLDYQYAPFFGGSLVTAALAVPSFLLFGPTLWALKLVPIATHLLALALLFLILDRFASRRAAWIGGLLFALSPPGYTLISTVAWGSHLESNALAMLCTWLFLDMHVDERGRARRRAIFGIVAGFSVWFGYQCLLFLAVLSLFDFLRDRRFLLSRELALQVGGFLIGFSPWIVYNLRFDFAGLAFPGKALMGPVAAGDAGPGRWARAADLLMHGLPDAFFFKPMSGLGGRALGAACAGLLAALVLVAAWRLRHVLADAVVRFVRPPTASGPRGTSGPPHPGAIALVYLASFALSLFLTHFTIGGGVAGDIRFYRYAMLAYPSLCITVAVGLDLWIGARPAMARPAWALTAALCALSLAGSIAYCDPARFGVDRTRSGISRENLGRWFVLRYCGRLDKLDRIVENASVKRTPERQDELYKGMGKILVYLTELDRPSKELDRRQMEDYRRARAFLASRVPEPYRRHFNGK